MQRAPSPSGNPNSFKLSDHVNLQQLSLASLAQHTDTVYALRQSGTLTAACAQLTVLIDHEAVLAVLAELARTQMGRQAITEAGACSALLAALVLCFKTTASPTQSGIQLHRHSTLNSKNHHSTTNSSASGSSSSSSDASSSEEDSSDLDGHQPPHKQARVSTDNTASADNTALGSVRHKDKAASRAAGFAARCLRILASLLFDPEAAPPLGVGFGQCQAQSDVGFQACSDAVVILLDLLHLLRLQHGTTTPAAQSHDLSQQSEGYCRLLQLVAARLAGPRTAHLGTAVADVASIVMRLDAELLVAQQPTSTFVDSGMQWTRDGKTRDVERLLQPVGLCAFLRCFWEVEPLLLKAGEAPGLVMAQTEGLVMAQAEGLVMAQTEGLVMAQTEGLLLMQQQQEQHQGQQQQQQQHHASTSHCIARGSECTRLANLPPRLALLFGAHSHSLPLVDTVLDRKPATTAKPAHPSPSQHVAGAWCERLLHSTFSLPLVPASRTDPCAQITAWHAAAHSHHQQQLQHSSKQGTHSQGSGLLLQPLVHNRDARLVRSQPPSHGTEAAASGTQGGRQQVAHELLPSGAPVHVHDIRQGLEAGYTLAMRAVGSRDSNVHRLQEALQVTFGLSPGANLYLTPQGAQGLAPHFDDHCVFVLQLFGEKSWLLRPPEPRHTMPLAYHQASVTVPRLSKEQAGVREVHLQEGDLLYIPRGWAHQANTHPRSHNNCEPPSGDPHHQTWACKPGSSMHLTFGLEVEGGMSWLGLLQQVVANAFGYLIGDGAADTLTVEVRVSQVLLHTWLCIVASRPDKAVLRRANALLACPEAREPLLHSTLQQLRSTSRAQPAATQPARITDPQELSNQNAGMSLTLMHIITGLLDVCEFPQCSKSKSAAGGGAAATHSCLGGDPSAVQDDNSSFMEQLLGCLPVCADALGVLCDAGVEGGAESEKREPQGGATDVAAWLEAVCSEWLFEGGGGSSQHRGECSDSSMLHRVFSAIDDLLARTAGLQWEQREAGVGACASMCDVRACASVCDMHSVQRTVCSALSLLQPLRDQSCCVLTEQHNTACFTLQAAADSSCVYVRDLLHSRQLISHGLMALHTM